MQVQSVQLAQRISLSGQSQVLSAVRSAGAEQGESAAEEARESPAVQRMEGETVRPQGQGALDLLA